MEFCYKIYHLYNMRIKFINKFLFNNGALQDADKASMSCCEDLNYISISYLILVVH